MLTIELKGQNKRRASKINKVITKNKHASICTFPNKPSNQYKKNKTYTKLI